MKLVVGQLYQQRQATALVFDMWKAICQLWLTRVTTFFSVPMFRLSPDTSPAWVENTWVYLYLCSPFLYGWDEWWSKQPAYRPSTDRG